LLILLTFFILQVSSSISGRVIDGKTGEPVSRAQVVLSESRRSSSTDESGRFEFQNVTSTASTIYVNAAGYALGRKVLKSGDPLSNLEVILVPEGAGVKQEITVTTKPFDAQEVSAASEQSLSKSEIQNASMVLIGDALRSGQSLPGVVANNDLRSDFSIRGAGFDRIGIFVDGVLTDNFVHSFVGDDDDRVSLSLIDQDTVETLSVMPGAFPAKYGDSSAAITVVETREGNRVRPSGRIGTGIVATSGVVDGPFANNRGSWLTSVRTTYADYMERLVRKITGTGDSDDDSTLDFSDAHFQVAYDFSPAHKVVLSGIAGMFVGSDRKVLAAGPTIDPDALGRFKSRNSLINASWRFTSGAKFVNTVRGFIVKSKYAGDNGLGAELDNQDRTQFGVRSDAAAQAGRNRLEFGFYGRRVQARKTLTSFRSPGAGVLENYRAQGDEDSYYVQENWNKEGVSFVAGARIEHSNTTNQVLMSPRAGVALNLGSRFTLRAGIGAYRQFPDLDKTSGFFGNTQLRADRAIHYNLRLERELNARTRLLAEAYAREDRGLAFALAEPRVDHAGQITIFPNPYDNLLDGYARGMEFTLQRRTANGFTGWVSYAFARTWLKDSRDGLAFVSDFDQRHTMNLFVSRRIRQTVGIASQFRYGSGQPYLGFLKREGQSVQLGAERNQLRLPAYARLDVRATKAFLRGRWKWTLSGEVLNVLNHKNMYNVNSDPVRFRAAGSYAIRTNQSFGILPAVGLHLEF
jgi:hypothetical protein